MDDKLGTKYLENTVWRKSRDEIFGRQRYESKIVGEQRLVKIVREKNKVKKVGWQIKDKIFRIQSKVNIVKRIKCGKIVGKRRVKIFGGQRPKIVKGKSRDKKVGGQIEVKMKRILSSRPLAKIYG